MLTSISFFRPKVAAVISSVLMAACGGGDSATPPVGGLTLDPGDGQVTVSWAATAGVEYWLGYLAASSVSLASGSPHTWVTNVSSPYTVTGLTNGTTYSFAMNGRTNGGPGGASTASVSTVPRTGGVTWTAGSATGTANLRSVAYGTASDATVNYVAVGDGGAMYRGTTGAAWTTVTTGPTINFRAALYTLSKFIAAGAGGNIYYSTDIATWTAATSNTTSNINALASNGTTAVAVGDGGTIRYSTDGITWTAAASVPTTNNLNGVTYAASGLWIAVGASGTLLTSTDGSTWTAQTSNTTANLNSVTKLVSTTLSTTGYTYVAVGANGTVLKSFDGATWTSATSGTTNELTAVVVPSTNSQFLAVGAMGTVMTSPDGITWTTQSSGTSANLLGMITAQVQYVAVGAGGVNINSH